MFTLPQKDVPTVQAAMAKGALTAIAYDQNDRTKLGEGTLLLVNNTINQSSGTVLLKATFPNANRALWPGEFVNVRLVVDTRHDAISVPLSRARSRGRTVRSFTWSGRTKRFRAAGATWPRRSMAAR